METQKYLGRTESVCLFIITKLKTIKNITLLGRKFLDKFPTVWIFLWKNRPFVSNCFYLKIQIIITDIALLSFTVMTINQNLEIINQPHRLPPSRHTREIQSLWLKKDGLNMNVFTKAYPRLIQIYIFISRTFIIFCLI